MHLHRLLLPSFLLLMLLFMGTTLVRGQEVSPSPSTTSNTSSVVSRESLVQQIEQVKQSYRGQLDEYRRAEQQYKVAKGEFEQLGTLTSLENAVQRTRTVMKLRAQVLHTYLTFLRLQLLDAKSIPLDQKARAISDVQEELKALEIHQNAIEQAADRRAITQLVTDFAELIPNIEFAANYSQELLTAGKLQAVHDQAGGLFRELSPIASSGASLKTDEYNRAHTETGLALSSVQADLQARWLELTDGYARGQVREDRQFPAVTHARLKQIVDYLSELIKNK